MNLDCAVTHKNEDAESKWCPFSWARMYSSDDTPSSNVQNLYEYGQRHKGNRKVPGGQCLTTNCMAWIDETDHRHEITIGRCGLVTLANC